MLRQNVECCAYRFEAKAGQTLIWRETGAVARMVLISPDGEADGPGIPQRVLLPKSGWYVLRVSPNLMAEGGFGRFTLTLTIPPLKRAPGGDGERG